MSNLHTEQKPIKAGMREHTAYVSAKQQTEGRIGYPVTGSTPFGMKEVHGTSEMFLIEEQLLLVYTLRRHFIHLLIKRTNGSTREAKGGKARTVLK